MPACHANHIVAQHVVADVQTVWTGVAAWQLVLAALDVIPRLANGLSREVVTAMRWLVTRQRRWGLGAEARCAEIGDRERLRLIRDMLSGRWGGSSGDRGTADRDDTAGDRATATVC